MTDCWQQALAPVNQSPQNEESDQSQKVAPNFQLSCGTPLAPCKQRTLSAKSSQEMQHMLSPCFYGTCASPPRKLQVANKAALDANILRIKNTHKKHACHGKSPSPTSCFSCTANLSLTQPASQRAVHYSSLENKTLPLSI